MMPPRARKKTAAKKKRTPAAKVDPAFEAATEAAVGAFTTAMYQNGAAKVNTKRKVGASTGFTIAVEMVTGKRFSLMLTMRAKKAKK